MSPHDIIYAVLLRDHDIYHADQLASEILERFATEALVVVPVEAVIRTEKQND